MTSPTSPPREILLMYGNGGGGHKATAKAIQTALQHHSTNLRISLIDATAISGASAGDWLYNQLLSRNAVSAIEVMHQTIQFFWPLALPKLRISFRAFFATHPHLVAVVSLIPMLNAVFAETLPSPLPLYTVFTDFSHTHSHPWIQHPRQHLVVGTALATAQALAAGYCPPGTPSPSMALTETSGMVVHPRFYHRPSPENILLARKRFGLEPHLPTILILFGGSPPTDTVVRLVDIFTSRHAESPVNLIAVCARNKQLYDRLARRQIRTPIQSLHVTGYTTEIPLLMQISHLLIGKPGPGVVSEAFVSRLPCVLVTGSEEHHVMKQERDVLDWVRREGIGVVAHTVQEAADVSETKMAEMKANIERRPENRAVFEVRDLIFRAVGVPVPGEETKERDVEKEEEEEEEMPRVVDMSEMDLPDPEAVLRVKKNSGRGIHVREEQSAEMRRMRSSPDADGVRLSTRQSSLSPKTITMSRSKTDDDEKRETLPDSRAVRDLGARADDPKQDIGD